MMGHTHSSSISIPFISPYSHHLGFLGIGYEPEDLAATLQACRDLLPAKLLKEQLLPIGVGFLTWNCSHEVAISGLLSNPPRAVWLFGIASTAELGTWCNAVRSNLPSTLIFYQGGSLEDITAAIELTAPGDKRPLIDAIVVQSSDAGGHGFARGASLMTLLPEVKDSIVEMKRTGKIPHDRVIPLLAAGGIMDSRGVAAVLALGADAAVLGTRLIATEESEAPDTFKELLVQAVDGGQTTARSTLFDTLRGHGDWPPVYDGRAIVNKSYVEAELQGVSLEIVKERYQTAVQEGDFQRVAAYA